MRIQGIIPPVATPMQANEDLDLPRLKWFLDHLIGAGVHGVFVLGTNSEFYAMDEKEKQTVIATAVEHVRGRVPVFAGTGAESTREAVRLTKMAEKEGVQGVSVITPYFVSPSQQEIIDHYRRIAENTSVAGHPVQQPGHVRRSQDRCRLGGQTGRDRQHCRHQGFQRRPAKHQRDDPGGARAVQRAHGPRHADLPGPDLGGARRGAGQRQHCPAPGRRDLRGLPPRRPCGSQGRSDSPQPGAASV